VAHVSTKLNTQWVWKHFYEINRCNRVGVNKLWSPILLIRVIEYELSFSEVLGGKVSCILDLVPSAYIHDALTELTAAIGTWYLNSIRKNYPDSSITFEKI
jgi:hypothetical protein